MKLFRFHVLLSLRSMRIVAPLSVAVAWVALIMAFPGTAVSAGSAIFMAYLVFGCWMTVVIGNIDDDAHRYVLTAAAGTRARLHVVRAAVALAYALALAGATSILIIADVPPKHHIAQTLVALLAVGAAGSLIGVAIGTFLHRPIIFNIAVTVVIGVLATVCVVALPPMQHVLYHFGKGHIALAAPLLAAAAAASALAVGIAAALSQMRSR